MDFPEKWRKVGVLGAAIEAGARTEKTGSPKVPGFLPLPAALAAGAGGAVVGYGLTLAR